MLPAMPWSGAVSGDQLVETSSMCFLHTFNTYQLLNRLDDTKNQQLQLIQRFASTKACNPNYLLHIGLFSSQGGRPNPEASEFAFSKCLSSLLELPTPDYQMVSMVLRRLVGFARFSAMEDDRRNEAAYPVYKQAYQIIVGLKEGEYPVQEGKWLAMTAWNRSGTALRLHQVGTARKWMKMGLDLAKRIRSMENYVGGMEECFANFEKVCSGSGCGAETEISPQALS